MSGDTLLNVALLMLALPLILNEAGELSPWLAARLLRLGARFTGSPETAKRYGEEWLADLEHVPGKLTKLLWSCGVLLCSVPRLRLQARQRARFTRRAPRVQARQRARFTRRAPRVRVRVLHSRRYLRLERDDHLAVLCARLFARLTALSAQCGLDQPPDLLLDLRDPGRAEVLLRWGRPYLVLGPCFARASRDELDAVLLHLLTHVRHHDLGKTALIRWLFRLSGALTLTAFLAASVASGAWILPDLVFVVARWCLLSALAFPIVLALRRMAELRADATVARTLPTYASYISRRIERTPRRGSWSTRGFLSSYLVPHRSEMLARPRRLIRLHILASIGATTACAATASTVTTLASSSPQAPGALTLISTSCPAAALLLTSLLLSWDAAFLNRAVRDRDLSPEQ